MIANAGKNPPAACAHDLLGKLHESQRQRYAKITNPFKRETWLMGRAYLMQALKFRFGRCDPEAIRTDADGRIYLDNHPAWISMSHSHRMIVISMSDARAGVDVEYIKMRNIVRRDSRIFSETENSYLGTLTESDRLQVFYIYWTLKEAACKATGVPLLACLQDFRFEMHARSFQVPPSIPVKTWYFESASVDGHWRMALAMTAGCDTPRIEYRQWAGDRRWQRLKPDLQVFLPSAAARRVN